MYYTSRNRSEHYIGKSIGPLYNYSSWSAMESHAMKLPLHRFFVNVNAGGDLEFSGYGVTV